MESSFFSPGHVPLTGAEPARRHVPATAACKAAALADMFEAMGVLEGLVGDWMRCYWGMSKKGHRDGS